MGSMVIKKQLKGNLVLCEVTYDCDHVMDFPARATLHPSTILPVEFNSPNHLGKLVGCVGLPTLLVSPDHQPEVFPYVKCPVCRGDLDAETTKNAAMVRVWRKKGQAGQDADGFKQTVRGKEAQVKFGKSIMKRLRERRKK